MQIVTILGLGDQEEHVVTSCMLGNIFFLIFFLQKIRLQEIIC